MTMENLNEEQNARADALLVAKNNLVRTGALGSTSTMIGDIEVEDLVDLAEWVLSGRHPMHRYDAKESAELPALSPPQLVLSEVDEAVGFADAEVVSDDPKLVEHQELKGIVSMHPGHGGATCSCGWHSHSETWAQHVAEVLRDHPDFDENRISVVDSDDEDDEPVRLNDDGPDFDGHDG